MPKQPLSKDYIEKIVQLRKTGHSLSEIQKVTARARTTIFKYIKNVQILPRYLSLWKQKRGGSKHKAFLAWEDSSKKVRELILPVGRKERLLILSSLYWGEGTKSELNLINSDPSLIKVFVTCLGDLGVKKDQLKITLRIFEDMDKRKVIRFWSSVIGVSPAKITNVNILKGKKVGKLEYGMCRVRVVKSASYFKLIMSMIDLIKSETNAAVVQRIEQDTPNV